MKYVLLFIVFAAVHDIRAWDSIAEMESDICVALTNNTYLASAVFVSQLNMTTNSASVEMKTEAYMLLSVNAYQNFLNTADASWLDCEKIHASNAVASINAQTNTWQHWMARFTYASAQISMEQFTGSYATLTNALEEITKAGYTSGNSCVERAILRKYEMPDLKIKDAMKVFAGLAAAKLGMGHVTTNYANQVPISYRSKMMEFIRQ